jgi:hypothetical protein
MADQDDEIRREPNKLQKILKIIAFPIALISGGLFAHRHARNSLYDMLKNNKEQDGGAFKVPYKEYQDELTKLVQGTKEEREAGILPKTNIKGKIRPLTVKYNEAVTRILEERGFNNTIDYFMELHGNLQTEVVLTFLSAASIALGVFFTLADNKELMEKLNLHQEQKNKSADHPQR